MKFNIKKTILGLTIAAVMAIPSFAMAQSVHIAVASNFDSCMYELIDAYGNPNITHEHDSSGNLIQDIRKNQDKYQLFFSADNIRPAALANDGLATNVSQYAQGKLVAYSASLAPNAIRTALDNGSFTSIAVGNPALAPYGVAGQAALSSSDWNYWGDSRITLYDNIGLTKDAADSLNNPKQIALISQGQVANLSNCYVVVDYDKYNPILQDACVIIQSSGSGNQAAEDFLDWVMTNINADNIIKSYGYLR